MSAAAAAAPLASVPGAVVFDMDGLMLDSERIIRECLARAAAELGLAIAPGCWLEMVGRDDATCRRMLGTRVGDAAAEALLARSYALYDAILEDSGIPRRPGIGALLELLAAHGIPRAVATSSLRGRALHKLRMAGLLPYFDAVCTASDVVRPKPAPDVYLLAASRLQVAPGACLVLEDSPTGVRAALAAGMTVIQVPDLLAPDAATRALGHRVLASLDEARQLLEARLRAG
ncbi:HAD family hydrolase [Xanthomonas massiliensis]|uniref:HAD family hydrolase n=1 Tax=Xanthomonas massiliensis TaxID=1720302 RepID=UPI000B0F941D|nr:HAD family phosphatase [Xanthomonas massiliensis]